MQRGPAEKKTGSRCFFVLFQNRRIIEEVDEEIMELQTQIRNIA